jgi:Secretion system C-terminal sorting domain
VTLFPKPTLMKKILPILILITIQLAAAAKTNQSSSDNDTIGGLPFRLQSFSARVVNNNQVVLDFLTAETWATVTHYDIFRSTDNKSFASVGQVSQTVNMASGQAYSFTDNLLNSTSGVLYYRLKQVNKDGLQVWSDIIVVRLQTKSKTNIAVWPNPSSDELNINFFNKTNGVVVCTYFSTDGKMVHQEKIKCSAGVFNTKLTAIKNWKSGNYFLQLSDDTGVFETKQIIKN